MAGKKISDNDIYPILAELEQNLRGSEGAVWCRQSKKFLNREPTWDEIEKSSVGKVRKNFVFSDEDIRNLKILQTAFGTRNETQTLQATIRFAAKLAKEGKLPQMMALVSK